MATTLFRRDHLLRAVVDPTGTAKDFLGRNMTSTADYLGRLMVAKPFAGTTAYAVAEYMQLVAGTPLFKVPVGGNGTSAAGAPTAPGPGLTVVNGTVTFQQIHP